MLEVRDKIKCRLYKKRYYLKNKEEIKRKSLEYYYLHHGEQRKKQREYKERLGIERRCVCCGTPLLKEERRSCVNCSRRIREEITYAKDSKRTSVGL